MRDRFLSATIMIVIAAAAAVISVSIDPTAAQAPGSATAPVGPACLAAPAQGHHHVGQGHRARFRRPGRLVYRSRMSCRRDVRSQGTDAWNVRKRRRSCKTAAGPL